jgi:hypothetical protein
MEKEQLLEFTINLSLEISKLERRVKELECVCSSCGKDTELENRVELCINNDDTLTKLINYLMVEVKALKETPQITVATFPSKEEAVEALNLGESNDPSDR